MQGTLFLVTCDNPYYFARRSRISCLSGDSKIVLIIQLSLRQCKGCAELDPFLISLYLIADLQVQYLLISALNDSDGEEAIHWSSAGRLHRERPLLAAKALVEAYGDLEAACRVRLSR